MLRPPSPNLTQMRGRHRPNVMRSGAKDQNLTWVSVKPEHAHRTQSLSVGRRTKNCIQSPNCLTGSRQYVEMHQTNYVTENFKGSILPNPRCSKVLKYPKSVDMPSYKYICTKSALFNMQQTHCVLPFMLAVDCMGFWAPRPRWPRFGPSLLLASIATKPSFIPWRAAKGWISDK